jgi:hypothetical protein
MAQVFGGTDVVEMFARQEMEARVVPMGLNHRVDLKVHLMNP